MYSNNLETVDAIDKPMMFGSIHDLHLQMICISRARGFRAISTLYSVEVDSDGFEDVSVTQCGSRTE